MADFQALETAAEYGRRSNCVRDHQKQPFRFGDHVSYIHATARETGSDGLVEQAGLKACPLPRPTIDLGTSVDHREDLLDDLCDCPNSPAQISLLSSQWNVIKDLLVPLDKLDVGSIPELDAQEYLNEVSSKRSCRFLSTWLPLSPTKAEKDEGLDFPSASHKFHSMMERELDQESVTLAGGAEQFEENDANIHDTSLSTSAPHASISLTRRIYVDVLTPPLSPVSDASSLFVPEAEVTVIGLASEASSPVARETVRFLSNAIAGRIDSDIEASPSTVTSSSPKFDKSLGTTHLVSQNLALDVPIMPTSSDSMGENDVMADIELPACSDADEWPTKANANEICFEEALEGVLVSRQSHTANSAEQEQLNPFDSISRAAVPVLNFDLPKPAWFNKVWSSREHLSWLQMDLSATCHILKVPRDARLESSLKWTPVPSSISIAHVVEKLDVDTASGEFLTLEHQSPLAGSSRYISTSQRLAIVELKGDEEIEELESSGLMCNDALSQDNGSAAATEHIPSKRRQPFPMMDGNPQTICQSLRRKAVDRDNEILPRTKDSSATSALLAGFMDLRAVKRPRTGSLAESTVDTSAQKLVRTPMPAMEDLPSIAHAPEQDLIAAPAPTVDVPRDKGPCFISLTLQASIMRLLEESWPPDMLLDRDYSQHNTLTWSPGTVLSKEVVSPLTFEADISLSPSTGVIVTTLLKVKQKALPGSKAQTPLRERVQKISLKYEVLVVLVSESNPAGEFIGTLSSSDVAAYADFVRFTASLDGVVNVYLVAGANKTLSTWILSLMCQHSTHSAAFARFISAEDSTWEVFLRRAGLNVVAAQVLSKTLLEEFGSTGLAHFLVMPSHVRISKYAQLLGGQMVLLRCCESLDRRWT